MKRVALVNQRYGMEVGGGSEYYTRLIAERLAGTYEVEVLTTKALEYTTWRNWYAADTEVINGITVRRFPVEAERAEDFNAYNAAYCAEIAADPAQRSLSKERIWFEKQGPYAPACIDYIRSNANRYDVFIFVTYLYYLTVCGLPEVAEKALLVPTAHDEPFLHFLTYEQIFTKPRGLIFLTEEERLLVRQTFPKSAHIPCVVTGAGVDVPPERSTVHFRRKYGLDEPYLIYIGRIDEGKNCPMMMRYFMEYKKRRGGNLKLVLMGKAVCDVPKHPDILPLGFVSEEDKWEGLAGAQMLLLPSSYESLSISVLEAMSIGVPVVVNGGCAVLKGHCLRSGAGLFYHNYFEFEGAVDYLLENTTARAAMARNARAYVAHNYQWENIMAKYAQMIERAAHQPHR